MSWNEFLQGITPLHGDGSPRLRPAGPPASPIGLDELEMELGIALPQELRHLLAEMNGVHDEARYTDFIMPVEEMLATNRFFREEPIDRCMPLDCFLFFGQAGNGDLYGYPITLDGLNDHAIFEWDHELDSRVWVAQSLRLFVRWWVATKSAT